MIEEFFKDCNSDIERKLLLDFVKEELSEEHDVSIMSIEEIILTFNKQYHEKLHSN